MNKFLQQLYLIWLYIINFLVLLPLGLMVWLKLNVRYKNLRVVYRMKPPYLVLPNHSNQWDPFILSWAIPYPIRWVASDGAFRDKMAHFLKAGGAIPKIKGQSDMVTIQEIRHAMNVGVLAGIFPEGEQNWTGKNLDLIASTAKLVRFLKVPVLVPILKGAFLTKPRWSWRVMRSRIEVHFQEAISAEEIERMKLSEIEERLSECLTYDEYAWQAEKKIPIHSKRRAEHLELALFACPSCQSIESMKSSKNDLACTQCGYQVHVDRFGFLQYPESGPSFSHPADWEQWERHLLETLLVEKLKEDGDTVLLRDAHITLMRGLRAMPMLPVISGEARLYADRIEVGDPGADALKFPFSQVSGVNMFKQQKFEFRFDHAQYRFRFPSRHVSGFKWEIAFKLLRDKLLPGRESH